MKILALDSSAAYACAALLEDDILLHEVCDNSGRAHSETLLPLIASMLEKHALKPHDVDLCVCGVGPGSYTGVRIGVATVKGLMSGSGKPCLGVSTLETLARGVRYFDGIVCPVIDARRDRVYTALFESKGGKLSRLTPDGVCTLPELDKLLKKTGRAVTLTGDGYAKAKNALSFGKLRETPERLRLLAAYEEGLLGLEIYLRDPSLARTEVELAPVYLGQTQAERELAEKTSGKTGRADKKT